LRFGVVGLCEVVALEAIGEMFLRFSQRCPRDFKEMVDLLGSETGVPFCRIWYD
jgi:hypothetical protein